MSIDPALTSSREEPFSGGVTVWCDPGAAGLVPPALRQSLGVSAEAMLRAAGVREYRISLALLSGAAMRRLNRRHLGHDHVTDVVTFDLGPEQGKAGAGKGLRQHKARTAGGVANPKSSAPCPLSGEICLCPSEARRNCRKYGEPFERELKRYVAHGILHLAGWSDRTLRLRAAMRAREDELLCAAAAAPGAGVRAVK